MDFAASATSKTKGKRWALNPKPHTLLKTSALNPKPTCEVTAPATPQITGLLWQATPEVLEVFR